MMPWNGWFSSFLKDKMGSENYDKLRKLVLYRPDHYSGFEQMPRPYMKLHISDKDPSLTHQFRHPSPGSQPPVELRATDPSFGNSADDPYNVAYYKRDTGRRLTSDPAAMHRDIEQIKLELLPQDDPRVKEAMEEFEKGPGSSPGNKGVFATGKSDYDPSGLRATMSTNWEATEKSLDENMPDHVSFVLFVLSLLLLLKEDVAFVGKERWGGLCFMFSECHVTHPSFLPSENFNASTTSSTSQTAPNTHLDVEAR
jgi:hypothetical protein